MSGTHDFQSGALGSGVSVEEGTSAGQVKQALSGTQAHSSALRAHTSFTTNSEEAGVDLLTFQSGGLEGKRRECGSSPAEPRPRQAFTRHVGQFPPTCVFQPFSSHSEEV